MRRHDIKIRRESLGRTRIERHKDFGRLMHMHKRRQMRKQLVKNIAVFFAVILLILLIIYGSIKLKGEHRIENDKTDVLIEHRIKYPKGILE